MTTTKTSCPFFRFSAAAIVMGMVAMSSAAFAADSKAPAADVKVAPVNAQAKVAARAPRKKAELPRAWRWKKYTKNFDSMFRK